MLPAPAIDAPVELEVLASGERKRVLPFAIETEDVRQPVAELSRASVWLPLTSRCAPKLFIEMADVAGSVLSAPIRSAPLLMKIFPVRALLPVSSNVPLVLLKPTLSCPLP